MVKKSTQTHPSYKKTTVVFGYELFVLALITIVVGTVIPWTSLLLSSYVLHRMNVAVELVSFVLGAALPLVIAYILGDRTTHKKNRLTHHFNGVLFGIAAYWVSALFSYISILSVDAIRNAVSEPLATVLNAWPILATILVMSVVAFYYAHNQKEDSVLQDVVYRVVLFLAVLGVPVASLWLGYTYDPSSWFTSTLYIVVMVAALGISYYVLRRFGPSHGYPWTLAFVAVGIGLATTAFVGQLIAAFLPYSLLSYVADVVGAIVWIMYLRLIVRHA